MGKVMDKIERALFGAAVEDAAERRLAAIVERRVDAYWAAAIELPDEAHRCADCSGEGYVLDVWPNEKQCAACGGTGLRREED